VCVLNRQRFKGGREKGLIEKEVKQNEWLETPNKSFSLGRNSLSTASACAVYSHLHKTI
jgi:hypothetical protein